MKLTNALISPTHCEKLSIINCETFSAQFLIILPNKVLLEMFPLYIGLSRPAMKPFIDEPHYIGNKPQVVDTFGDSVARVMLSGGDFIRSHGEIQTLDVFIKAGYATTVKARNLFHGKIPNAMLKEYMRKYDKKDAMIPDILIHNYSTDANAYGTAAMQATFYVKEVRVDKAKRLYKVSEHAFKNPAAKIRSAGC
mmetsp:Transcript_12532/g.15430  ORF Transcript_12532/g.15430 Transcript_12532/m.15430 type:complete len:195 (+) Transcript_12532:85-669(+)